MTSIPAERRVRPANARATTRPRSGAVLRRALRRGISCHESNASLAHTVTRNFPYRSHVRPRAAGGRRQPSRARRCQQPARWPGHSPGWQGRRQVRVAPSLLRLHLTGRVRFLGLPDATKHERACDWGTEENERKTTDRRRIAPRFAGKMPPRASATCPRCSTTSARRPSALAWCVRPPPPARRRACLQVRRALSPRPIRVATMTRSRGGVGCDAVHARATMCLATSSRHRERTYSASHARLRTSLTSFPSFLELSGWRREVGPHLHAHVAHAPPGHLQCDWRHHDHAHGRARFEARELHAVHPGPRRGGTSIRTPPFPMASRSRVRAPSLVPLSGIPFSRARAPRRFHLLTFSTSPSLPSHPTGDPRHRRVRPGEPFGGDGVRQRHLLVLVPG